MNKNVDVSISVIKRLPRYHRFLGDLIDKGITRISSSQLAISMHLTASQIRQDLNCFGGFGQQGYGYNIVQLHNEIGKILRVDVPVPAVLIGAGNLGRTIATHIDFSKCGFDLIGIFDSNPSLIGQIINGITVKNSSDLQKFCSEFTPKLAILCIPKSAAVDISDLLIGYGFKGIWNFSQYDMVLENSDVFVENVRLSDSLMTVRYHI